MKEAMELIEIQAKKKKIELRIILPHPSWDVSILTDHNRLIQIIINLLSNALKFTFKGSISLAVANTGPNVYQFSIADTGIGIKEEDKAKLFKEFTKLDHGRERNEGGVGLGLVISNSLAKILGPEEGEKKKGIWFSSEEGKGSTFFFSILDQTKEVLTLGRVGNNTSQSLISVPSEKDGPLPDTSFKEFEYAPHSKLQHSLISMNCLNICTCPEILIVDDDGFCVGALETVLHQLGHTTLSAFNAPQALEELAYRIENPCGKHCKPFKLIFLDTQMPIMNGFECARGISKIFKKHPNYQAPIVGCSGNAEADDISYALKFGFDDYCVKPINKGMIELICTKYANVNTATARSIL
jgi:CheY-like chemotaxis protein